MSEWEQIHAQIDAIIRVIPEHYLLNPPNGGDVTVAEGVQRMADRIAHLESALLEIRDRHVPDQPSCLDIDESDYILRQHTELRRIARAALEQEARDE